MNKWVAIAVMVVLALGLIVSEYFLWQQTSALGDARSEIADLDENVKTLEETKATLEGNVATLQSDLAATESDLAATERNVATLEGNVTTLEGNVASLEGNITSLEGNIATLEGEVSTLETVLVDSEAEVSSLETELAGSKSQVSSLQSSLSKANADISTQQTINSALSEELKTVKFPRHFASLQELTDWLYQDDTDTKYADEDIDTMSYILMIRALRDGYLLTVSLWPAGEDVLVSNDAVIGTSIYSVNARDDEIAEWATDIQPLPSHPLPPD